MRVIQEKSATDRRPQSRSTVRVVSATDKGPLVDLGEFRQDLYYRINVIELHCCRCADAARTSRLWPNAIGHELHFPAASGA